MCLIAWSWQPDSATPLLLIGNRDESYARPAQALHHWPDAPVLAGRDVQAGGTWLGVSHNGRLAALTNYRSAEPAHQDVPSRGGLVTDFLNSRLDAESYLQALQANADAYNPFNLLVYDGRKLLGLESRGANIVRLQHGIGGVSNADFNTPWPKLRQLTAGLSCYVKDGRSDDAQLWPLLQTRALADDAQLPNTGIPLTQERALSATFVATQGYGTRACSVVRMGRESVIFSEQRFGADGALGVTVLSTG